MAEADLAVAILREIRDEIRETRMDLGGRIEQTNVRLDRLESETIKMAEALKDLAAQQLMLGRYMKNVVERHEQLIDDLRERLVRLESRQPEPR